MNALPPDPGPLCRSLDEQARKRFRDRVLPWAQPASPGGIDYWKAHAYALDRIEELLERALPERESTADETIWRGRHRPDGNWVEVSLLSGRWSDAAASRRGWSLPALIGHVYRMPTWLAAVKLGQWLNVEVRRHA